MSGSNKKKKRDLKKRSRLLKHGDFALLPKARHLHNVVGVEGVWDVEEAQH
jgi:hypothetical protein